MTYSEVLQAARGCSGPYCKACPVCNGRACGSSMPGPGAKGTGTVAVRNYEAWQSIRLDLDTICENKPMDTRYTFFGQQYDLPVFAGPVGATKLHYGEKYDTRPTTASWSRRVPRPASPPSPATGPTPQSSPPQPGPSVPPAGRAFLP